MGKGEKSVKRCVTKKFNAIFLDFVIFVGFVILLKSDICCDMFSKSLKIITSVLFCIVGFLKTPQSR